MRGLGSHCLKTELFLTRVQQNQGRATMKALGCKRLPAKKYGNGSENFVSITKRDHLWIFILGYQHLGDREWLACFIVHFYE